MGTSDSADLAAQSTIQIDPDGRTIIVMSGGFWDPEFIKNTFAELRKVMSRFRAAGRPVRVIVDYRTSTVQSVNSVDSVQSGASISYRNGDRVALIVSSALVKRQLRRIERHSETEYFSSLDDAKAWLHH